MNNYKKEFNNYALMTEPGWEGHKFFYKLYKTNKKLRNQQIKVFLKD